MHRILYSRLTVGKPRIQAVAHERVHLHSWVYVAWDK